MNQLERDIYSATIEKLAFWPFTSTKEPPKVKIPVYVDDRYVDETTGEALPALSEAIQQKGVNNPEINNLVHALALRKFYQKNNIFEDDLFWPVDKEDEYAKMRDDFIKNTDPYEYLKGDDNKFPINDVVSHLRQYELPYYKGQKPTAEEDYDSDKHWWRWKEDPSKFSDLYPYYVGNYEPRESK